MRKGTHKYIFWTISSIPPCHQVSYCITDLLMWDNSRKSQRRPSFLLTDHVKRRETWFLALHILHNIHRVTLNQYFLYQNLFATWRPYLTAIASAIPGFVTWPIFVAVGMSSPWLSRITTQCWLHSFHNMSICVNLIATLLRTRPWGPWLSLGMS